jgi:hypothetical protein
MLLMMMMVSAIGGGGGFPSPQMMQKMKAKMDKVKTEGFSKEDLANDIKEMKGSPMAKGLEKLSTDFDKFDSDGDGKLKLDELKKGMDSLQPNGGGGLPTFGGVPPFNLDAGSQSFFNFGQGHQELGDVSQKLQNLLSQFQGTQSQNYDSLFSFLDSASNSSSVGTEA